jgi:hypothetical protein
MEENWNDMELYTAEEEERLGGMDGCMCVCVCVCVCVERSLLNYLECVPLYQSQRSSAAD